MKHMRDSANVILGKLCKHMKKVSEDNVAYRAYIFAFKL